MEETKTTKVSAGGSDRRVAREERRGRSESCDRRKELFTVVN